MDTLAVGTQRLVHFDLKGAPPKPSYFEKILPLIKSIGATGILLEWEDTFPYMRELLQIGGLSTSAQVIGAPYTVEDAKHILNVAADCDLTVVPLVQTFGHMEFVLKHEQWRVLREVEAYPSSMCPSNSEAMPLVRSMIKQIVAFHPNIQYLHIGADEIWHLGLCSVCSKRVQNNKYGKAGLYLDHVTEVARFVKENYPHLKVIMWDDMLRNIDLQTLQAYYLGTLVEPMIWHYHAADAFLLDGLLFEKYSEIFSNVWGATAFKGSTSSCQIMPVNRYHISNHEGWLIALNQHAGKISNFRGIAMTGWSRFDHYATLCEMLPCAIPSLCLCIKTWLSGGYSQAVTTSVNKTLGYVDGFEQQMGPLRPASTFPGWEVCSGFEWLVDLRIRYKNIVNSDQLNTWFNQWQVTNNYTNPMQLQSFLPAIGDTLQEIGRLEAYLKDPLEEIFYQHTIEELVGTLITPMKQHLLQIKADCETQMALGCGIRGRKKLNL